MSESVAILFDPANPQHTSLIPAFADIHIACIETDHMIANFIPPLKRDVVIAWWNDRVADVVDGKRLIFMVFAQDAEGQDQLAGYVILYRPLIEDGPFRAFVEKLLVSPNFRRRGLARKLMEKLDTEAKLRGQTLLMVDTETGSPAESMYPKFGYIRLGVIPNYACIESLDESTSIGTVDSVSTESLRRSVQPHLHFM